MARASTRTRLSLGYRIGYRLRMAGLTIFGPAQLGEADDPKRRLQRQRAAREEAVRQARAAREQSRTS